jgi:glutathione peroxidase
VNDLFTIAVTAADGTTTTLGEHAGKVLLIVNTASKCGFTPQYAGLEVLWRQHRERGFAVLAFPCNQFGAQEPGDAAEIASFCSLSYDVSFPIYGKIDVNGEGTAPLYRRLKAAAPGVLGTKAIKWNFTKFLVDRRGAVAGRFAPTTKPEAVGAEIARLL